MKQHVSTQWRCQTNQFIIFTFSYLLSTTWTMHVYVLYLFYFPTYCHFSSLPLSHTQTCAHTHTWHTFFPEFLETAYAYLSHLLCFLKRQYVMHTHTHTTHTPCAISQGLRRSEVDALQGVPDLLHTSSVPLHQLNHVNKLLFHFS